jgi:SAM-dependent methyltransferase
MTISAPSSTEVSSDSLLELGFGFCSSKVLLTAIELGVFGVLAAGPVEGTALARRLGLHERSARDFLDALVALRLLDRERGEYRNAPSADAFLDPAKPAYIGGIFEMANARLYPCWRSLTEALRTGRPQNELENGDDVFGALYADPASLRQFLHGMSGVSAGIASVLADRFPWARYGTVIDIGCAQGRVPAELARRHPHLSGGGFDLPPVGPIFDDYVAAAGLSDRLRFYPGDFFTDPLPEADVLIFGQVLHDWGLEEKRALLDSAYRALPSGGAVVVYDAIIDDERRHNTFGFLVSLTMALETERGFDYTGADCLGWLRRAGFGSGYVEQLTGAHSMAVGIK